MSTSLYQKYRPQQFSDLVGQDHVRRTLLNELQQGAVSHAYLFAGPRGIGKTTAARLLARAVNCLQLAAGEPCNKCAHCRLILDRRALDLVEIDAASHTGVDNVRENIIENSRVAPAQLGWKVFIIDEVHMLSISAFNALLKTLEEPPQKVIFILATTEVHKVPATIVSRCEQFHFRKISFKDMVQRLQMLVVAEEMQVEQQVLETIARKSEGALRDAESLLGQVLSLDRQRITMELAQIVLPTSNTEEMIGLWSEIVNRQLSAAVERVNRLVDEGVLMNVFVRDFIDFLRRILLYKVQGSVGVLQYLDLHEESLKQISELAVGLKPRDLLCQLNVFLLAAEQLKTANIIALPFELALVELIDTDDTFVAAPHTAGAVATAPASVTTTPQKISTTFNQYAENIFKKKAPVATEATNARANSEAGGVNGEVNLSVIQRVWPQVLEQMKRRNHGLHLTFQVGHLISYDEKLRVLTLGYQYKFYQDRLADARNRPIFEEVLQNIFKCKMIVQSVVDAKYAPVKAKDIVENIAEPSSEEVADVWELATTAFEVKPKPEDRQN